MEKTLPSSLTVEEAVAEMVNMDYIPAGLTLLDMTEAFQEEAEVDYENACIDKSPEDQLTSLKIRMDSCKARHTLAQLLLESLNYEVKNPKKSTIVLSKDSSSHPRLTRDSVWEWAADRFGIGISLRSYYPKPVNEKLKNMRWEDVAIKINEDLEVSFKFKKGKFRKTDFGKIFLMDKRNKVKLHNRGKILVKLSFNQKFPSGKRAEGADRKAVYVLRCDLCKLTGLSGNPFLTINEVDGWKPRFDLTCELKTSVEIESYL